MVLNLLECHSQKGREASDKDMVTWALRCLTLGKLSYHVHSKKLHSPGRWHTWHPLRKPSAHSQHFCYPEHKRPCVEDRVWCPSLKNLHLSLLLACRLTHITVSNTDNCRLGMWHTQQKPSAHRNESRAHIPRSRNWTWCRPVFSSH